MEKDEQKISEELRKEIEFTRRTIWEILFRGLGEHWKFVKAWYDQSTRHMCHRLGDMRKAALIELCSLAGYTYVISSGEYRCSQATEWHWSAWGLHGRWNTPEEEDV